MASVIFLEGASRSFPLFQDAPLDRASLNVWSHRIGHWLTPRASLSKQMRKIFKKNLFTEYHALPRSCSTQYFAGRILQAQLSSRCFCQKTLNYGLDAKCLRTATPLSKQTSDVIRDFHSGAAKKQTEETNSQSLSTAQFASASDQLTHVNDEGCASMVDVGMKPNSERTAVASAVVRLGEKAFILVQQNQMKKGDVLAVAQIAGIQGAKLTSQLIPLCHNIPLSLVDVSLKLDDRKHAVMIRAVCRTHGKTGVEMEALTAVSLAALTVYDMCKAVTHDMVIEEVQLLSKEGGQRGNFHRG